MLPAAWVSRPAGFRSTTKPQLAFRASSEQEQEQAREQGGTMADELGGGGGGGKAGGPTPPPSMGEAPLPPHIIRGCVRGFCVYVYVRQGCPDLAQRYWDPLNSFVFKPTNTSGWATGRTTSARTRRWTWSSTSSCWRRRTTGCVHPHLYQPVYLPSRPPLYTCPLTDWLPPSHHSPFDN